MHPARHAHRAKAAALLKRSGYAVGGDVSDGDDGVPDDTDSYNTELSPDEEKGFQSWKQEGSKASGRDLDKDLYDYDLRGQYKDSGGEPIQPGHGSDLYKKPNHPTFSDESKYHGKDGNEGGHWTDEEAGTNFTPGSTNLKSHSKQQLRDYFDKAETYRGVGLNMKSRGGTVRRLGRRHWRKVRGS